MVQLTSWGLSEVVVTVQVVQDGVRRLLLTLVLIHFLLIANVGGLLQIRYLAQVSIECLLPKFLLRVHGPTSSIQLVH